MVGANSGALANGTAHEDGRAFVSGSHSGSGSLTATKYSQQQQAVAAAPAPVYTAPVQQAAPAAQAATKAAEEFKETIDWVEVALDRIQRTVDKLETLSDSVYRLFVDRNKSMSESFAQVTEQIKYQEAAYTTYMNKANSYGVSQDYINKINAGHWSIEDITDKDLYEKIKNVMDYTEKAFDARDAIEELKVKLGDIAKARFDLAVTKYDAAVEELTHSVEMLDTQLEIVKNRGNFAGRSYYEALVERETKVVNKLQEEYDNLVEKREEALKTGAIETGSEADNDMIKQINEIESSWQEATNSILEYKNAFLEMDTEAFKWAQGLIDDLRSESDFVQDLLSIVENKMFNKDTGRLNEKGMAVGSLHAMNYDVAMAQADEYRKKVDELNTAIKKEPTNTLLINQRDEYLKLQRDSIAAANEEKKAIQSLVSDSYNRMLDILQKLINKRKEMLQQEKSLYDYERNIKDQTKTITDYRKQLLSLQGDDSEETRAKRQEISENLKDAEKNLEASEYDRYIQDQERLFDSMYDEFSRVLNERLDNIDGLLSDMIDYGNAHASDIGALITSETAKVGYTMTDGLNSIWNSTDAGIGKVLSEYTKNFAGNFTTVNKYIKGIFDILKETTKSKVTVDTPKNNTPAKPATTTTAKPAQTTTPTPAKKAITVGGMINAGSAPIYNDSYGSVGPYGTHQYYASDPIYVVMKDYGEYILARHHTQTAGAGFFKKTDVTAMNTGGYTGEYEGMAMLHKKERVLNAQQTKAFEQLVYDYLPLIKDQFLNNSGIGMLNKQLSLNPSEINGNIEMNFNLPNVTDADGFIKQLQSDSRFERIVQHMVFDGLSGKGNLRKNLVRVGK